MWKKIIIKFYFYCTKIRALLRTSLMFLWELKNAIISQNLRELCVIKANTNIPHIVASTSSATYYFITRCLSLSKAHSHFSSRCLSLLKAHSQFSSRCLSLSKAHYFYCIKIRVLKEYLRCSFENSKTVSFHKIFVNFVLLKQTQIFHT